MDSAHEELRTAKLTALQNQIVPHYIVNTLEAIRMKLILEGQTDNADLLLRLQNGLKTYGFSPYDKVTVTQEFTMLEDWLKLHEFRFLGKLNWEFAMEAQVQSLLIPRFLLQPLVENALRHGLNADMPNPKVYIKACLQGDELCLSVTDNGCGVSQEKSVQGIGLTNINARLSLLYGDSCKAEIHTVPGDGTCVTLRLPGKGSAYI